MTMRMVVVETAILCDPSDFRQPTVGFSRGRARISPDWSTLIGRILPDTVLSLVDLADACFHMQ